LLKRGYFVPESETKRGAHYALAEKLAGPEGLNIRDEIRVIRRGLYLGRAYFGPKFALNFTLLDPAAPASASPSPDLQQDCAAAGGR